MFNRLKLKLEKKSKEKQKMIDSLMEEKAGMFERMNELYAYERKGFDVYRDIQSCRNNVEIIHNALRNISKEQEKIDRYRRILNMF